MTDAAILPPTCLKVPGATRSQFDVLAPIGTRVADLINPFFWTNVALRLNRHDLIDVTAEDESFDATVRVVEVEKDGNAHAKVRLIRVWQASED